MAWFGNKKNNTDAVKSSEDSDWNKDLKRNIANRVDVKQQNFTFKENTYKDDNNINIRTKKGLSLYVENITSEQIKILKNCDYENSAAELIKILNRTNKTKFKQTILYPLIDCGFLELTIPDKPKSPKQTYRLTGKFVTKNTNF